MKSNVSISVSPSNSRSFSLLSLLEEVTPDSLKNNEEASIYLASIDKLVKLPENDNDYLKFCLVDSILQILVKNKEKYTEDEKAAKRLSRLVDSIKDFCPDITSATSDIDSHPNAVNEDHR